MRPVTNEVEYMFPENEFGTYPDIEEVGASYTSQSCILQTHGVSNLSCCRLSKLAQLQAQSECARRVSNSHSRLPSAMMHVQYQSASPLHHLADYIPI